MLSPFRSSLLRAVRQPFSLAALAFLLAVFRLFLSGDSGRSAAVAGYVSYLPLVASGSLLPVDLAIDGLEVNQSIQTSQNTIPLVAHRPAMVRVYARTGRGEPPLAVTVALVATRGGSPLGSLSLGPQSLAAAPGRGDYASTFNARLPADWLWGQVELVAYVDPANAVHESDEGNNAAALTLTFNEVPPLDLKIVPVNYTHQGTLGTGIYPGRSIDPISDWLIRTFPLSAVNVTYHTGYNFSGDLSLSSEWVRLLVEMTGLKAGEGAPDGQVYYALVPTRDDGNRWFIAGIAGIGWLGHRVSVGLDLNEAGRSGSLAGHEIGHNFGRAHAPCGGPSSVDAAYPYAGASIGEYGLDVASNTLLDPATTVDMMSYCRPEWISDYTYLALYADQRTSGLPASGAATPALLVQAQFDVAGTAWLQPLYMFPQIPTPPAASGNYAIELLNTAGHVVVTHPVAVLEADEPGVSARLIHASVPLPAEPVARVRLRQAGIVTAERALAAPPAARATASISTTAGTMTLGWGSPETPALVRYSADDGQSWTMLALNRRGGQLTVEAARLPGPAGRFQIVPADTMMSAPWTVELAPGK